MSLPLRIDPTVAYVVDKKASSNLSRSSCGLGWMCRFRQTRSTPGKSMNSSSGACRRSPNCLAISLCQ